MADQFRGPIPKHIELQRRFEGVTDPGDMGTTGLAAWTLEGPGGQPSVCGDRFHAGRQP
jgi:hypothetical protein